MEMEQVYLESILKPLLNAPDELRIERKVDERGVLLLVSVAQQDMGNVIGKGGVTANALRRLLHQLGAREKKNLAMKLNEPNQQ